MAKFNSLEEYGKSKGQTHQNDKNDTKKKASNDDEYPAPPIEDILSYQTLEEAKLVSFLNTLERYIEKNDSVQKLTSGQVRNIYSIIHDAKNANELHRKRPEIAFVIAKQSDEKCKLAILFFLDLLKRANDKNFNNIKEFTASFLKYHKFYGRK